MQPIENFEARCSSFKLKHRVSSPKVRIMSLKFCFESESLSFKLIVRSFATILSKKKTLFQFAVYFWFKDPRTSINNPRNIVYDCKLVTMSSVCILKRFYALTLKTWGTYWFWLVRVCVCMGHRDRNSSSTGRLDIKHSLC